jgi:hypothetical protein
MLNIMRLFLGTIARLFCARRSLLLENLALRQQLAVFKRRHPRTRLTFLDKLFWVAARQICSDWKQFLIASRHGRAMAPIRVCALLALNFQVPWTGWQKTNCKRDPRFDFPDGRRKCDLGSTSHSW